MDCWIIGRLGRLEGFLGLAKRLGCGWLVGHASDRSPASEHPFRSASMSSERERFDQLFMAAAHQSGGIEPLLSHFFSFLQRRTDFYVVQPPGGAEMGFPPGVAEAMLRRAFRSYPLKPMEGALQGRHTDLSEALSDEMLRRHSLASMDKGSRAMAAAAAKDRKTKEICRSAQAESAASGAPTSRTTTAADTRTDESSQDDRPHACERDHAMPCSRPSGPAPPPRPRLSKKGVQVPVGNGGVTARYWWTQTLQDATVCVPVPSGTRSRDVACIFSADSLRLAVGGARSEAILDGRLDGRVRAGECLWQLEGEGERRTVVLTLEKRVETWWERIIEGDDAIDTTLVDSTQRMEEYDEETQGAIRKIMFDQAQKARGLPTSDEMKTSALLAEAMKMPGAPNIDLTQTRIG